MRLENRRFGSARQGCRGVFAVWLQFARRNPRAVLWHRSGVRRSARTDGVQSDLLPGLVNAAAPLSAPASAGHHAVLIPAEDKFF